METPAPERPRVLLVESGGVPQSGLAEALGHAGWDVARAEETIAAFQQARQTKPQAVVVRVGGSSEGGLQLLQRMRGSSHTALIPVVAVLDCEDPRQEEFRRWGAQACLEEPVDATAVAAALQPHTTGPAAGPANVPPQILAAPLRMAALQSTQLLDTPPEELFDRVTALAAHLLHVPTVLMSLVDRHRQFFKSAVGLPAPIAAVRETPVSHSFCQWVVADRDELIVPDVTKHSVLRLNPATVELGVRAYAGVPLHAGSAEPIGSFCAIDSKPHDWDQAELTALRAAARVVEAITVLRQSARLPPVTFEDLGTTSEMVARALEGAIDLARGDAPAMSARDRRELLDVASEIAGQLARLGSASGDQARR